VRSWIKTAVVRGGGGSNSCCYAPDVAAFFCVCLLTSLEGSCTYSALSNFLKYRVLEKDKQTEMIKFNAFPAMVIFFW
jgi:hypothetical protein